MAARAYWQGQIRLALVSIPIEVYPATKSGAAISFHQIHEPSGKRIRYEKVAPGVGPVDRDEIIKGYEISKGNYVLLDEEEIEAVKIESRKTLELVQFVDAGDIDVLYYETPYFIIPADDLAEEAYIVLREALRQSRKVGLGQLAVRGREQLVSIKPCGRGLVMEVLRYADEVHKAQGYFREIGDEAPDADLLDLATTLIEKKSAPFHPAEFHDRYIDALHRLIDKKAKSKSNKRVLEDVEEPSGGSRSNVIDLMAALKKSVGESGSRAAPAKSTTRKAPAKKASAPETAGKKAAGKPAGKTAEKPGEKGAVGKKPPAKKTAEAPARSRKRA
ncbi:Ku protein [Novosphingobium sp.]|uniref:non-homologous end joining protein Ku n=1 Tax=Novosphingobium sp. TaxID=1874826 RepID=UPI0028B26052|nr:Ku protein [Novosphingobium sp.]